MSFLNKKAFTYQSQKCHCQVFIERQILALLIYNIKYGSSVLYLESICILYLEYFVWTIEKKHYKKQTYPTQRILRRRQAWYDGKGFVRIDFNITICSEVRKPHVSWYAIIAIETKSLLDAIWSFRCLPLEISIKRKFKFL